MKIYNNNTGSFSRSNPWWIATGTIEGRKVFGAGITIAIALSNALKA
jgi:hypothetical protein